MDIEEINKKYKYLLLNTITGDCEILSSDRSVSKTLKETYQIELSHMYIKRHVEDERYILRDNILTTFCHVAFLSFIFLNVCLLKAFALQ